MAIRKAAAPKTCFIVRRYSVKTGIMTGCICNVVRNEAGKEYQCWTYADGTTHCDCPATKECYHVRHVVAVQMGRCDDVAAAKARKVAVAPVVIEVKEVIMAEEIQEEVKVEVPVAVEVKEPVTNISRIEDGVPAWMLSGRQNGTFSGRAQEEPIEGYFNGYKPAQRKSYRRAV